MLKKETDHSLRGIPDEKYYSSLFIKTKLCIKGIKNVRMNIEKSGLLLTKIYI